VDVGVAGNISGPIYQGGALRAQKRQSVAFREQTKLQYAQTIQAFKLLSRMYRTPWFRGTNLKPFEMAKRKRCKPIKCP
jgi:hypothetical protein